MVAMTCSWCASRSNRRPRRSSWWRAWCRCGRRSGGGAEGNFPLPRRCRRARRRHFARPSKTCGRNTRSARSSSPDMFTELELYVVDAQTLAGNVQRIADEQRAEMTPQSVAATPMTQQHRHAESATPLTAPSPALVGMTPAANAAAHSIPRTTISPASRCADESSKALQHGT